MTKHANGALRDHFGRRALSPAVGSGHHSKRTKMKCQLWGMSWWARSSPPCRDPYVLHTCTVAIV